ncbi:uncharacterized protein LOC135185518 [Pogoniulus pusillus]|uniref:uncharacterized protein LOC135185518 n=1 Tax=Pogoniulus pusillus TaxID=488313 RepID=UPI0030B954A7
MNTCTHYVTTCAHPRILPPVGPGGNAEREDGKALRGRAEPSRLEPNRSGASRAEPSSTEASRTEPKRSEPSRAELNRGQSNRTAAERAEPSRAQPRPVEPNRSGASRAEPSSTEASRTEPKRSEPSRAELNRGQSNRTAAERAEPSRAQPRPVEPNRSGASRAEPSSTEASRTEPKRSEPSRGQSNRTAAERAEPSRVELNRSGASRAQPSRVEPKRSRASRAQPSRTEPERSQPSPASRTEPDREEPGGTEAAERGLAVPGGAASAASRPGKDLAHMDEQQVTGDPSSVTPQFVPPPEATGKDIIPVYCSLLAAVVVGLLAYVAFKCWHTCRQKQQLAKARAGDMGTSAEGEKLHSDSGVFLDTHSLQEPHQPGKAPRPEGHPLRGLSPQRQEELEQLLEAGGTGGDWRSLATSLGFSPDAIGTFGRGRAPARTLLSAWAATEGATVDSLCQALAAIGRQDVAQRLVAPGDATSVV